MKDDESGVADLLVNKDLWTIFNKHFSDSWSNHDLAAINEAFAIIGMAEEMLENLPQK